MKRENTPVRIQKTKVTREFISLTLTLLLKFVDYIRMNFCKDGCSQLKISCRGMKDTHSNYCTAHWIRPVSFTLALCVVSCQLLIFHPIIVNGVSSSLSVCIACFHPDEKRLPLLFFFFLIRLFPHSCPFLHYITDLFYPHRVTIK